MKYNFMRFPHGKEKAVTLSYDDGSELDIRLLNIVNKYNMKCTFNLVGNMVEKGMGLSKDFIKESIIGKGHEIANHGFDHRALDSVRSIEGIQDTLNSRLVLEREFNTIIRGMAFPDNCINRFLKPDIYQKVKNYLKELDIAYVRSAGADNDKFELPEDWYCWMPTAHHTNPQVMEYIDKFLSLNVSELYISSRRPRLFYLWGHSFEYENDNNWELLEAICEKLSGKDNIWYATNMEIYNYVEAYNSLIYSADGTVIYNPTLYTIWFDIDKTLYSIKPGETLFLKN